MGKIIKYENKLGEYRFLSPLQFPARIVVPLKAWILLAVLRLSADIILILLANHAIHPFNGAIRRYSPSLKVNGLAEDTDFIKTRCPGQGDNGGNSYQI